MRAFRMDKVSVGMIGGDVEEYLVVAEDVDQAHELLADHLCKCESEEWIDAQDIMNDSESFPFCEEVDELNSVSQGVVLLREYSV